MRSPSSALERYSLPDNPDAKRRWLRYVVPNGGMSLATREALCSAVEAGVAVGARCDCDRDGRERWWLQARYPSGKRLIQLSHDMPRHFLAVELLIALRKKGTSAERAQIALDGARLKSSIRERNNGPHRSSKEALISGVIKTMPRMAWPNQYGRVDIRDVLRRAS